MNEVRNKFMDQKPALTSPSSRIRPGGFVPKPEKYTVSLNDTKSILMGQSFSSVIRDSRKHLMLNFI